MTRVNGNIHPSEIVNKHLQAEYFEIRRVRHYKPNKKFNKFVLGTGHVKFFSTNRLTTMDRLATISQELLERGLVTQESIDATKKLFTDVWLEFDEKIYQYSADETDLVRLRLMDSLQNMYKKAKYNKYGSKNVDFVEAVSLLKFETENGIAIQNKIIFDYLERQNHEKN